ncbi:MAG: hypothetical protein QOE01_776 [Actinomycetota bacterium]|jgi:uncharacterized protein (TIGR03085 family)|nr:hypothetical protein [Actinomycetota bacterium]
MPSIARSERAALTDLLDSVGPDAPTLCTGWTTRDLAAHLAMRERRMDAVGGIAVPVLAGHAESVRREYAGRRYPDLVALVRGGPPFWSAFAVPGVDRIANTTEYFVHHEDVRRAQPGWAPRSLHSRVQDALWAAVTARGKLAYRSVPCGVLLQRPGGQTARVRDGEPAVTVAGEPAELLLHAFGRRGHALVDVSGPVDAVASMHGTDINA